MDKGYLTKNKSLAKFLGFLPQDWQTYFTDLDYDNLSEIRIRVNQPISVKIFDKNIFLKNSLSKTYVIPTIKDIENLVYFVCNKSIYAYVNQLVNGYVPFGDGVRIGVCGEYVYNAEKIVGIKNFSSLNVRIPHQIKNCSDKIKDKLIDPLKNVLIISKPGCGKTTFLRDLIFQLKNKNVNTLIIDEREEIAAVNSGKSIFELNESYDVISNCLKKTAFITGIRSMSPDLVVCDELVEDDVVCLNTVVESGVKVFATVHADNLKNAILKLNLNKFSNLFERFVLLSDKKGVGTIEGVYDKDQNKLL